LATESGRLSESEREALAAQYFVDDGGGVIGPVLGDKLKELIENGAVPSHARLNRVGAPAWTPLLEIEPFRRYVRAPAAAPKIEVAPEFAGFWIRLAAFALDYVFYVLAAFVFVNATLLIATIFFTLEEIQDFVFERPLVGDAAGILIMLLYQGVFVAGRWQATPGKRLLGLHIVRTDGERVTSAWAALRFLCYFLSLLPFGAGFAMIFFSRERCALHDIICRTRVVRGRL